MKHQRGYKAAAAHALVQRRHFFFFPDTRQLRPRCELGRFTPIQVISAETAEIGQFSPYQRRYGRFRLKRTISTQALNGKL